MKDKFVMRGQTASGETEILQFGGRQKENKNMAYRMTEFSIYPSSSATNESVELGATVTAAKTFEDPANPNFNNPGLIGTALFILDFADYQSSHAVVNDTFLITQDLVLAVVDTKTGSPTPVNWQCRFEAVKMTDAETAATNFKQYTIFDE